MGKTNFRLERSEFAALAFVEKSYSFEKARSSYLLFPIEINDIISLD